MFFDYAHGKEKITHNQFDATEPTTTKHQDGYDHPTKSR